MVARGVWAAVGALLPIAGLLWFFLSRDAYPEPRRAVWVTFVLGLLAIVPAVGAEGLLSILGKPIRGVLAWAFYEGFVVAALPEETLKLLIVRFYSARRTCFDEPMDGIVYGTTAALGFAALENLLYVYQGGWTTALLRALTSVPLHASCGAILGYAVAVARFDMPHRFRLPLRRGLTFAVLVHGLYDAGLLSFGGLVFGSAELRRPVPWGSYGFLLLSAVSLLLGVRWTARTIRRLRAEQQRERAASLP